MALWLCLVFSAILDLLSITYHYYTILYKYGYSYVHFHTVYTTPVFAGNTCTRGIVIDSETMQSYRNYINTIVYHANCE